MSHMAQSTDSAVHRTFLVAHRDKVELLGGFASVIRLPRWCSMKHRRVPHHHNWTPPSKAHGHLGGATPPSRDPPSPCGSLGIMISFPMVWAGTWWTRSTRDVQLCANQGRGPTSGTWPSRLAIFEPISETQDFTEPWAGTPTSCLTWSCTSPRTLFLQVLLRFLHVIL